MDTGDAVREGHCQRDGYEKYYRLLTNISFRKQEQKWNYGKDEEFLKPRDDLEIEAG